MIHDLIVFVLGCVAGGVTVGLVYHNNLLAAQGLIAELKAALRKV